MNHIRDGADPLTQQSDPTIGFTIYVHVYYPDVWDEMCGEIVATVRQPFGLVITRPPCVAPVALPDTPFLRYSQQLEVENRGRDILPFLKALRRPRLPVTDIGLKLHTKRSPHRADGADWRRFLCNSLLQSDTANGLLGHALLTAEQRIGLIAPNAHLLPLYGRTSINDDVITEVLTRLYGGERAPAVAMEQFAAGSMFWFRRSALDRLLAENIDTLFAAERGQLDGTAAHALERLFATIVEQHGQLAVGMENTTPIMMAQPDRLTTAELQSLIDSTLNRENPFSMTLSPFWRDNPRLLKLAHAVYARMPKRAIRVLRAAVRRS
ncbi:rhamnan synthesis F family protein [Endobacterium cereale]|uniref:rhamnan synthesis F family protein n=1 Tax=Endobacterium cereale TaxID=2663029 RepID=UPI002B4A2001|nr:rhamnan synthesis F family protein [Endobacterium cereale]MEB2848282.1 rhamnan synthesis F family protein [Endobacterium cereale]